MSVSWDPATSDSVVILGHRVVITGLVMEDARLAEWLGDIASSERKAAVEDLIRLGLALKVNHQLRELNESLKETADATLEKLSARIGASIAELDGRLRSMTQGLDQILDQSVAGDHSKLRVTMAKAFEEMRLGLQQTRVELAQVLDPRHADSVGAQLESRLREHIQILVRDTFTPRLQAVAEAVGKLESAIQGQDRLKQERMKGHGKGLEYEWALLDAIQEVALPTTMLVRRVADEKGINGTKDGDLVIEYNGETLVTIECKDAKSSKIDQLESAIAGRQAYVGIMAHRHPNGPTAHMHQGSVRIVGDNKILLVWDPEQDDPALLTAVVGLSLLLAQRLSSERTAEQHHSQTIDLGKAQTALDILIEKLDLAADVLHHFDLINANADKGKKAVEKLKKELERQYQAVLDALGLGPG
jgi:hypothetical protein